MMATNLGSQAGLSSCRTGSWKTTWKHENVIQAFEGNFTCMGFVRCSNNDQVSRARTGLLVKTRNCAVNCPFESMSEFQRPKKTPSQSWRLFILPRVVISHVLGSEFKKKMRGYISCCKVFWKAALRRAPRQNVLQWNVVWAERSSALQNFPFLTWMAWIEMGSYGSFGSCPKIQAKHEKAKQISIKTFRKLFFSFVCSQSAKSIFPGSDLLKDHVPSKANGSRVSFGWKHQ